MAETAEFPFRKILSRDNIVGGLGQTESVFLYQERKQGKWGEKWRLVRLFSTSTAENSKYSKIQDQGSRYRLQNQVVF